MALQMVWIITCCMAASAFAKKGDLILAGAWLSYALITTAFLAGAA